MRGRLFLRGAATWAARDTGRRKVDPRGQDIGRRRPQRPATAVLTTGFNVGDKIGTIGRGGDELTPSVAARAHKQTDVYIEKLSAAAARTVVEPD